MSASQPAAATKTNEGFCSGDLRAPSSDRGDLRRKSGKQAAAFPKKIQDGPDRVEGRYNGEEHRQEWLCDERKSSGIKPACGGQSAATFVRSKLLESAGLVADSNYG